MTTTSAVMQRTTILMVFAACIAMCAPARAANIDFSAASGNWNTAGDWVGGVIPTGADNAFIGDSAVANHIIAITASPASAINELGLGRGNAGTQTINHSVGALITNSWTNLGQDAGKIGIYNLSGGSVTKNGGGHNVLGGFGDARGELHITGSALWSVTSGDTRIGGEDTNGAHAATVGIITVGDTGQFSNTGGVVFVGRAGTGTFTHNSTNTSTMTGTLVLGDGNTGVGNVQMNNGTLNVSGGMVIANGSQGMGTVEVNNGILAVSGADIQIGRGNTTNTPILDINGGAVTHTVNTVIGRDGRGIIDISGGSFQTNLLIIGEGGATQFSRLNVSGTGALTTTEIEQTRGGSTNGLMTITGSQATITTGFLDFDEGGANVAGLSYIADAAGVSEIDVSGNVEIAGTVLSVDLSQYTGSATTLTLIDKTGAGGVSGIFTGLAEGASVLGTGLTIDPTISYVGGGGDNNNVVLNGVFAPTTAPEPSTFLLAALGMMGLALSRSRGRKRA